MKFNLAKVNNFLFFLEERIYKMYLVEITFFFLLNLMNGIIMFVVLKIKTSFVILVKVSLKLGYHFQELFLE